ncbi:MAG: DUF1015 domain-containing protein [Clostridia bacterium]|nr:DUF1015 domain-containing protein [Clostridia bacterium]
MSLNQKDSNATLQTLANTLGVAIPELYIPHAGIDLSRWAVVACDQYTSQPEYWQQTETLVGDVPSTLRLVLPEIYLEQPGDNPVENRIARINQAMDDYLDQDILVPLAPGCMVIDRSTRLHPSRIGLLIAIDLERYDFTPGNRELTRATEGTVLDRIPPRQAIRKDALLELPHVQLLIDDPGRTVIEPLHAALSPQTPLYATDLAQEGGFVKGWHVSSDSKLLANALTALGQLASLKDYGLLFAVGDGNHSLATAKAHWNSIKSDVSPDHPARYALAEVINIHDSGLDFEPIHRAVFNIDFELFLDHAERFFTKQLAAMVRPEHAMSLPVPVYGPGFKTDLAVPLQPGDLVVGAIQAMLDDLLARHPDVRLDYIHGEEVVQELSGKGAVGLVLPSLEKSDFFGIIARDGILPRKTFSMGEAFEKRYYFESRRIR